MSGAALGSTSAERDACGMLVYSGSLVIKVEQLKQMKCSAEEHRVQAKVL